MEATTVSVTTITRKSQPRLCATSQPAGKEVVMDERSGTDRGVTNDRPFCRFMRLSDWMWSAEGYIGEVFLIVCSLWATWALWHPPSNFAAYKGAYLYIAEISPDEGFWGTFAALAAIFKMVGLFLCLVLRWRQPGESLRLIGLGMSGSFWTLLGLSTTLGNPDTLLGMPVLLAGGFGSWWILLRFPLMPKDVT